MTGKEWDKYFKTLNRERKEELRTALLTLDSDPIIRKEFGLDFKLLASILDFPLK